MRQSLLRLGYLLRGDEHQRLIGVLEDPVHDDVRLADQVEERSLGAVVLHDHLTCITLGARPNADVVAIEHLLPHLVIGALDADRDVPEPACLECVDGPPAHCTEADDDGLALVSVVPVDALQLQCMQHRAIAGQFVVLVERVPADVSIGPPDEHLLERDESLLALDRHLGQSPLLNTVRPAPEDATFTESLEVLQPRLGKDHRSKVGQELATCRNAACLRAISASAIPRDAP